MDIVQMATRSAARRSKVPSFVLLLFLADLAFAAAYLINFVFAWPFEPTRLADLDGEANLPAWYASTQLAILAALSGLFAYRHFTLSRPRSWSLAALALLFLAFSVDETAAIHESLAHRSDVLLPDGSRDGTSFERTGIWIFLIGLPAVAAALVFIRAAHHYLKATPGVTAKYLTGLAILAAGALGLEGLANLTERGSKANEVEVFLEELLEMVGVTVLIWGTLDLLRSHRLRLSFVSGEPLVDSRPM